MKEYNHNSRNVTEACGITEEEYIKVITQIETQAFFKERKSEVVQFIENEMDSPLVKRVIAMYVTFKI